MATTTSPSPSWLCVLCSSRNRAELRVCELCRTSRHLRIGRQPPPPCVASLGVCLKRLFVSLLFGGVTFVAFLGLSNSLLIIVLISILVFLASFCIMCIFSGRRAQERQPVLTDSFLLDRRERQRWISRSTGTSARNERVQRLPTHQLSSTDVQTALPEYRRCAICIEDFAAGETQRTLPCFHRFHVACIDEWLQQSELCPICKLGIDAEPCVGSLV
eukprot:TRINITY_DN4765_c0_g1_i1.p1 TRINITY_DN4765_c0_g1~~TRINITY_DN4765_c0_g1_i1.p1  ORF type:complete len:217 (-),score=23.03 TRINITY_DN4765_c0_g1_i1:66-716(-)